jgi:hypothetical protein
LRWSSARRSAPGLATDEGEAGGIAETEAKGAGDANALGVPGVVTGKLKVVCGVVVITGDL